MMTAGFVNDSWGRSLLRYWNTGSKFYFDQTYRRIDPFGPSSCAGDAT